MVWLRGGAAAFVVLVLSCSLVFPQLARAQGAPFFFTGSPFDLFGVQCSLSAKVGYQQMAVNFNLPVPFSGFFGAELAPSSTLDFKLQDSGVWIGGVEANLRRGPITAFVDMEANAKKDVRVLTSSEPFYAGEFAVNWRGSSLEWWAIDGGAGLDTMAFTLLGGLRVEHLSLSLSGPVDSYGLIQYFAATYGDHYSGDFLSTLWLPYLGIRFGGGYWRSTLRFSPIAWTDLKIPARYFTFFSPTVLTFEDASYTFKRGGLWVDGNLDYDLHTASNFRCSLWLRTSWLRIQGEGTEGYRLDVHLAGIPPFTPLTESNSATGVYIVPRSGIKCEKRARLFSGHLI